MKLLSARFVVLNRYILVCACAEVGARFKMEDNEQVPSWRSTFTPIPCRSKRIVTEVDQCVVTSIADTIDRSVYLAPDDKERCSNTFKEVENPDPGFKDQDRSKI